RWQLRIVDPIQAGPSLSLTHALNPLLNPNLHPTLTCSGHTRILTAPKVLGDSSTDTASCFLLFLIRVDPCTKPVQSSSVGYFFNCLRTVVPAHGETPRGHDRLVTRLVPRRFPFRA